MENTIKLASLDVYGLILDEAQMTSMDMYGLILDEFRRKNQWNRSSMEKILPGWTRQTTVHN